MNIPLPKDMTVDGLIDFTIAVFWLLVRGGEQAGEWAINAALPVALMSLAAFYLAMAAMILCLCVLKCAGVIRTDRCA